MVDRPPTRQPGSTSFDAPDAPDQAHGAYKHFFSLELQVSSSWSNLPQGNTPTFLFQKANNIALGKALGTSRSSEAYQ